MLRFRHTYKGGITMKRTIIGFAVATAFLGAAPAFAGKTLDSIKQKGQVS